MNAIETRELTKTYGDFTAVNGLNMTVSEGELYALLGVNGAGKTTTIKMLTCLCRPTSGDALLLGDSIITSRAKVTEKTNVSPQETAVAPNLSVLENLIFMARIYGKSESEAKAKSKEIIASLKLGEVASKKARILSGGWQRRLSIALALVSDPKILFLDEPTLGLDVIARRELWHVIRALHGKVTIILTTHYLEEAEALADRIGIIAHGNLMAEGTAEQLKAIAGTDNFEDAFINIAAGEDADGEASEL